MKSIKGIDKYGCIKWINDSGELHRENGPAVEDVNGDMEWWVNGKLHRDNGPAIIWSTGTKMWIKNGEKHRLDGPAVEYFDGDKMWHINGEHFEENIYHKKVLEYKAKIRSEKLKEIL